MLAALVPFILPHKHSVHDNDSPVPNRKRSAPVEAQDDLAGDSSSDEEGHYLSPMEESEDEAESLSMHDVYSDHEEEEEESSCMMLEYLHSHPRFNLLTELPTEILFHVLQYLSPRHLLSLRLVPFFPFHLPLLATRFYFSTSSPPAFLWSRESRPTGGCTKCVETTTCGMAS
jgi:hypothetical protein